MNRQHLLALTALGTLLTACTNGADPAPGTTGIPATTQPGNISTSSNVGLSATTPIPVADLTVPDGVLAIDDNGDVLEHRNGDWTVLYDGPSWNDPDAQSWATGAVRIDDRTLVSLCCEPVVGITVDAATGEPVHYGETLAYDGDGLSVSIDWTRGLRINAAHDQDPADNIVADIPLIEISGDAAEATTGGTFDVRFDADGGLYILWNDGEHDLVSYLPAGESTLRLADLPVLWTAPDGNAGTELASPRHQRAIDGVWLRYGTNNQAVLGRAYIEPRTAQLPVIIPLPAGWPAYGSGTVVIDGTVIATDGADIHLYRIADRAAGTTPRPSLVRVN